MKHAHTVCPRTLFSQSEGPGDKTKPSVYSMIVLRSLFVVNERSRVKVT